MQPRLTTAAKPPLADSAARGGCEWLWQAPLRHAEARRPHDRQDRISEVLGRFALGPRAHAARQLAHRRVRIAERGGRTHLEVVSGSYIGFVAETSIGVSLRWRCSNRVRLGGARPTAVDRRGRGT